MVAVNGWELFAHPLFLDQLERLSAAVERKRAKAPRGWRKSANAKLLAALRQLVFETIPQDPSRSEYRQGGTLGSDRKHWFRAKFGAGRFRLFFRYSTKARIIVFAWVNDETTLRTYGAKSDAYAVFRRMLDKGGSWSVYWYNGVLVSSEIVRGLDIMELMPSAFISQNEIDAAKSVHFDYLNAQGQPKLVWPASFAVARSYLDQLARGNGLGASRISAIRGLLAGAEKASASDRTRMLSLLALQIDGDAGAARDATKVRSLAAAVRDLGAAAR